MSQESYSALATALGRGETLPSYWYTDPAITERERNQIFRKTWSYIGPANELKNVGDYITGYVGDIPVVVIRNETGLAALVNVCRHRRHEVMKGRGNAPVMKCGYHAWTYDLTGCLKGAPRTAAEPGFRLEDYPLLPLKVDTLGPWVFVNVDREADPLANQYGKILDVIAQSGIDLDSLELYSRVDWEAYANWKTMLENYLECYHCAVAHPGFSAAIDVLPENYNLGIHGWFMSQVGHVRQSALEGKSQVKIYDARGEVAQAQYHVLFPNMTININPGFPQSLDRRLAAERSERMHRLFGAVFRAGRDEGVRRGADRLQSPGRYRRRRPHQLRATRPAGGHSRAGSLPHWRRASGRSFPEADRIGRGRHAQRPQGRRRHARSGGAQHFGRADRVGCPRERAQQLRRARGGAGRAGGRAHQVVLSAPARRQAALFLGARPVPADPRDDPGAAAGNCGPIRCRRQAIRTTTVSASAGTKATPWSRNSCMPTPGRASAWRPWRRVAGSSSATPATVRPCWYRVASASPR